MPAFDYALMLKGVNDLIRDAGQQGFIRRQGEPTGPAHNPTPGVATNYPATFVLTDLNEEEMADSRTELSDKKALVAPGTLAIDIRPSDTLVEADGTTWQIVPPVVVTRPATTTLLIELLVRR